MEVDHFTDYRMSHAAGITTLGSTTFDNTLGAMLIGALFSMTHVEFLLFLRSLTDYMHLGYGE